MKNLLITLLLVSVTLAGCATSPDEIRPQKDNDLIQSGEITLSFAGQTPSEATLIYTETCAEITDQLKARLEATLTQQILEQVNQQYHYYLTTDMAMGDGAPEASSAEDSSRAVPEVTGTNNQEKAADEADILKTDGTWTYVLKQNVVHITKANEIGDITPVSQLKVPLQPWGTQLLLTEDKLIVLGQSVPVVREEKNPDSTGQADSAEGMSVSEHRSYYYDAQQREIQIYKFNEARTEFTLTDTYTVPGYDAGARLIDGKIYVVTTKQMEHQQDLQTWLNIEAILNENNLDYEQYYQLAEEDQKALRQAAAVEALHHNKAIIQNLTLADLTKQPTHQIPGEQATELGHCQPTYYTPRDHGNNFNYVMFIDPANPATAEVNRIINNHPTMYANADTLILAAPAMSGWWYWWNQHHEEATNIHWIKLTGDGLEYEASAQVKGQILDSFSLDVEVEELRIVTTTGSWGRWWLTGEERSNMTNHLAILSLTETNEGTSLTEIGRLPAFAENERIWSSRFTEDRAYVVTFQQIDPLWIIDLTDPTNPTILGELEIPGVSTYIHPLNKDYLLTIGMPPGEEGIGLDWGKIQVNLFNIKNESNPHRVANYILGPEQGWGWSQAAHEHKAFNYWHRTGQLAIPMSSYDYETYDGNKVEAYILDINQANENITLAHVVDQAVLDEPEQYCEGPEGTEECWYYHWTPPITRTFFYGYPDEGEISIYSFSENGLTSHDLQTGLLQDQYRFE